MKLLAFIAALHAALLCLVLAVSPAGSGSMTLLGVGVPAAGGGGNPFALDGTPQGGNSGGTTAFALPAFSTTFGNDVVYIAVLTTGAIPSSISGGSLTFASRVSLTTSNSIMLYKAIAASPLSSEVYTVNFSASSFVTAAVFAFSGAHSASPFDPNGAIPTTSTGAAALSFTTSNANDILIAAINNSAGIDAPFTSIFSANFLQVGYHLVSATQAGSTATSGGSNFLSVGDAIIKGP